MHSVDEFQTKSSPDVFHVVESLRASFQERLESGGDTSIESWMDRVPVPLKATAFSDLLLIELRFRQKQNLGSDRESYRQRFPVFVDEVESCFGIIDREIAAREATASVGDVSISSTIQPTVVLQKPAVRPAGKSPQRERNWQSGQGVGLNGRYRLEKRVGRGGFAEVWKGYDANFQQTVAIKVPRHLPAADEESCVSFLQEARKQRSIEYRGIVKIYDVDEWDTAFFIISEFIEGPTLAAEIKAGSMTRDRAVEIVHSLALSLDKAHQQGLFHRDIKPANILLRPDGSPAITDFGLAISEAEQLGRSNRLEGTYSYMSPEQAGGHVDLLDGRSDIYSLGVILFELLTQRLPFLGATRNELLHQIIHKPALPLRTLNPTIPARLEEICLKCLAKDPTQRYATGQDLADALEEWRQSNKNYEPAERSGIVPAAEIPPPPAQKKQLLPWSYRLGMATMLLIPIFSWAIYRWPEPKPPIGPDSPRRVWLPMLKEPVDPIVKIRVEETDFLQQDTNKLILTARTEGGPWIVAASTSGAPPLRMQCKLFMDNWVGMAGLAWGISPEDRDNPTSMPRCFAVVIERYTATDPLRISLYEFHTQQNTPDQTMIGPQTILSSKEIRLPKTSPTHFEVTIDPKGVTVLIDKTQEWKPHIVEPRVMEDLETINGRTGFILRGKTVSISDAAVKF